MIRQTCWLNNYPPKVVSVISCTAGKHTRYFTATKMFIAHSTMSMKYYPGRFFFSYNLLVFRLRQCSLDFQLVFLNVFVEKTTCKFWL